MRLYPYSVFVKRCSSVDVNGAEFVARRHEASCALRVFILVRNTLCSWLCKTVHETLLILERPFYHVAQNTAFGGICKSLETDREESRIQRLLQQSHRYGVLSDFLSSAFSSFELSFIPSDTARIASRISFGFAKFNVLKTSMLIILSSR